MKIAAITDDGQTVSQHFGRARYYLVLTVENEQVTDRQLRNKVGHAHFADEPHPAEQPGQPHGFDPVSQNRHAQMAETIADCQVLICGGMGMGAYESMRGRGIKPVVTDVTPIDDAVRAYVGGTLPDLVEKLH